MADTMQYSFARYEQKYFLTPAQQAALLARIAPHIQRDVHERYTICNLYYDTDDWRLIRASLEKPVYKEKLRVRSYGVPGETDSVFVELKKKFDGVVYKRRVTAELPLVEPLLSGLLDNDAFGQIGREIEWFQRCNRTVPKVFIGYDREAFAGLDDPELRVTFDTRLRWRETKLDLSYGDHGRFLLPEDAVLMEVKLPSACPLWLSRALSDLSIYPTSFSKYGECYRTCLLPAIQQARKEAAFCA